ncbi:Tetratricopeptide repeat-containing protein [Granulicella rosea]|uniref:Tetratricopeptide repeat-containing protein n=1 Tax=Granulicella rosea TaxID=474952 RepID=A0A239GYJ6_9BACT|nr:tetratricopeptide repeat protein [Granulicella rosea]SNS74200.1 Tetratricopeptide repeat-containing protein [Granulicella rosea]
MRPRLPANAFAGLSFVVLGALPLHADTAAANAALLHGRVDEATAMLKSELASNPSNATAHLLLCRAAYAQDQADAAVDECRKAVAGEPSSSDAQMWLGRALGLKTTHSSLFSQMGLAKQVRTAFERAVQLSPSNVHAASDLGEFYIHAPGMVGGGADKARSLAASLQQYSPARSHRLLAQLAQKNGDMTTAENEFKAAIDSGKTAETYIDLAIFYQQTKRTDQILPTINKALAADRTHGPAEVDAASILTKSGLAPQIAQKALRDYLRSDAQTDETPAFKVHTQLGDLLKSKDPEGARREYQAALALASGYGPARKGLQSLPAEPQPSASTSKGTR